MPPVVLNLGMGVDSAAILLRWLREPESRDFELSDLTVLTAQAGDEFPDTAALMDEHIVPLMREHAVRWVQVARAGASQRDGIVVLEDSRSPTRTFLEAAGYRLSDEMRTAGTVPQRRKFARTCSQKFKKFPLETWLRREFGEQPFRQVMGFNADERGRADRDTSYSSEQRQADYPLIEWGWGRERCEAYLREQLGVTWQKSCCYFCPFMNNESGLPRAMDRLAQFPELAAEAAAMERVSRALNPRQTLFAGRRGGFEETMEDFDCCCGCLAARDELLDAEPWALYRSRKVFVDGTHASRDLSVVLEGSYGEVRSALRHAARQHGARVEIEGRFARVWLSRKERSFPCMEDLFAVAPARANAKRGPGFAGRLAKLEQRTNDGQAKCSL